MQPKVIKADSLGLRLATVYGDLDTRWGQTDICTLRQHMLLGVFKLIVAIGFGTVVLWASGLLDVFAWLGYVVVNLQWIEPSDSAMGLFVGVGVLAGIVGLVYCVVESIRAYGRYARRRRNRRMETRLSGVSPVEPSAFELAYTSWKEKLCYPVKIEK